jgi:hypothetical protein
MYFQKLVNTALEDTFFDEPSVFLGRLAEVRDTELASFVAIGRYSCIVRSKINSYIGFGVHSFASDADM